MQICYWASLRLSCLASVSLWFSPIFICLSFFLFFSHMKMGIRHSLNSCTIIIGTIPCIQSSSGPRVCGERSQSVDNDLLKKAMHIMMATYRTFVPNTLMRYTVTYLLGLLTLTGGLNPTWILCCDISEA